MQRSTPVASKWRTVGSNPDKMKNSKEQKIVTKLFLLRKNLFMLDWKKVSKRVWLNKMLVKLWSICKFELQLSIEGYGRQKFDKDAHMQIEMVWTSLDLMKFLHLYLQLQANKSSSDRCQLCPMLDPQQRKKKSWKNRRLLKILFDRILLDCTFFNYRVLTAPLHLAISSNCLTFLTNVFQRGRTAKNNQSGN